MLESYQDYSILSRFYPWQGGQTTPSCRVTRTKISAFLTPARAERWGYSLIPRQRILSHSRVSEPNLPHPINPAGNNSRVPMNCPNCNCMLELNSLEYRWRGNVMEAKSTFSCPYCHQVWVKAGKELVRPIPLTEVEPWIVSRICTEGARSAKNVWRRPRSIWTASSARIAVANGFKPRYFANAHSSSNRGHTAFA